MEGSELFSAFGSVSSAIVLTNVILYFKLGHLWCVAKEVYGDILWKRAIDAHMSQYKTRRQK